MPRPLPSWVLLSRQNRQQVRLPLPGRSLRRRRRGGLLVFGTMCCWILLRHRIDHEPGPGLWQRHALLRGGISILDGRVHGCELSGSRAEGSRPEARLSCVLSGLAFLPLPSVPPPLPSNSTFHHTLKHYTICADGGTSSCTEQTRTGQKSAESGYYATGGKRYLCPQGTYGTASGSSSSSCGGVCQWVVIFVSCFSLSLSLSPLFPPLPHTSHLSSSPPPPPQT